MNLHQNTSTGSCQQHPNLRIYKDTALIDLAHSTHPSIQTVAFIQITLAFYYNTLHHQIANVKSVLTKLASRDNTTKIFHYIIV